MNLNSSKRVFEEATTTPRALGIGQWVRSNPLRAAFVLVRQPNQGRQDKTASGKRRAYLRVFLARLLLTLEDCRTTAAELVDAIGRLDQWVANDHDALLAG